jgi:ketosteroid isomerase-like protein
MRAPKAPYYGPGTSLQRDVFAKMCARALAGKHASATVLITLPLAPSRLSRSLMGRASIRKTLESFVPRPGRMTLETHAVVESPQGLAVLHGRWTITPLIEMGAQVTTRGLSTEVVRKQPDGTWLFVIDNPYTPE